MPKQPSLRMTEPLNIHDVVKERDVFKLAIRGHAAIEDAIDAAIAEGFGGTTPSELRRLPFKTRLALLVALTPLPKSFVKPLDALAQLRHDFAHGRLNELSWERVNDVAKEFRSFLPEPMRGRFEKAAGTGNPIALLVACLLVADVFVEASAALARTKRERERKAVKLQEGIKELLEEHEK